MCDHANADMGWPIEILRICLLQKVLKKYYMIKKFNVAINPKQDGYQRALHQDEFDWKSELKNETAVDTSDLLKMLI